MDLMQMAGHLSLEFGAEVEGPYGTDDSQSVRLYLNNGRGVSLAYLAERDAPGYAELVVLREIFDGRESGSDTFRWVHDYSTPVTWDVVPSCSLDDVRKHLATLRDMAESNRYDLRTGRNHGNSEKNAERGHI